MKYAIPSVLLIVLLGLGACKGPPGPQGNTGNTGAKGSTGGNTVIVVPPEK
jgi:hypothetical protein